MTHEELYETFKTKKNVTSASMFGARGLFINGHCFMALHDKISSVLFRVEEKDQKMVMKLKGAAPFDPMGTGKGMKNWFTVPYDKIDRNSVAVTEAAFSFASQLPPKIKKPRKG